MKYTSETFIEAAKKVHGDKYDYSQTEYKNIKEKVAIICPKHGLFTQVPESHLKGNGCRKCGREKWQDTMLDKYGVRYPQQSKEIREQSQQTKMERFGQLRSPNSGKKKMPLEEFIQKARSVHGDVYDYSKVVMDGTMNKVEIICPEHGSFFQTPNKHLIGHGCSHKDCVSKRRGLTSLNKFGVKNPMQSEEVQAQVRNTNMERYGVSNVMQCDEIQARLQESNLLNYGVKSTFELEDVKQKSLTTKKENGTYSVSEPEDNLYQMLLNKFSQDDIKRQYRSGVYPFLCDFYIKSRDLYIELNACFTHGPHWFDSKSETDLNVLESWKVKLNNGHEMYAGAIDTWTSRDILKRQAARNNNLNYVVFWDSKLRDAALWFSLDCPDGMDWECEYSWLPVRDTLQVGRVNVSRTGLNLSRVVKYYQQDVFYSSEKELWAENNTWKSQGVSTRAFLYYNRLKYLGKNPSELTDFELLRGFNISGMHHGYSVFDVNLMEQAVEKYNIKSIYDPCAGWGERMLFCHLHDIEYFGVDINDRLGPGYENMIKDFDMKRQAVLFCDSSQVSLSGTYDCVFTCPPYGSKEIYSVKGAENLGHDAFLNWWGRVVENSLTVKPKYFMFQINQKWLSSMAEIVVKHGFRITDRFDAKILASHMNKTTKREFESLVVLEKYI